jgi:hypothetical protein
MHVHGILHRGETPIKRARTAESFGNAKRSTGKCPVLCENRARA